MAPKREAKNLKPAAVVSRCVGCHGTLMYRVDIIAEGAPKLRPPLGSTPFGEGHLCPDCTTFVRECLGLRRAKRTGLTERALARVNHD